LPIVHKRRRGLDEIDQRIGAVIRHARAAKHMSQVELGAALGVTFQQIQKYENGTNGVAATRMVQLCRALGITPNTLVGWGQGSAAEPSLEWSAAAVRLAAEFEALSPETRGIVAAVARALKESK
jgi:transcriptional regulator with XRE-family HTH domain